jgi:DNA-binding NarL/FixJ family response regulator
VPIPFPAHVLIADDHAIVRTGLRAVLGREPDLSVVAEAADGREALERGLSADIHLAVLDISMPLLTGLQVARELSKRRPGLGMLMLSVYDKEQYLYEALAVGASGYVLKRAADQDIVEACRATLRGEPFIYPVAMKRLMARYLERPRADELLAGPLTPRETEVVKLIAEGFSSHEIAGALVISIKTVERHRANILAKLGMRDRVQVARYAIRRGLIEP